MGLIRSICVPVSNSFADLSGQMVASRMDGRFLLGYSHGKALVSPRGMYKWDKGQRSGMIFNMTGGGQFGPRVVRAGGDLRLGHRKDRPVRVHYYIYIYRSIPLHRPSARSLCGWRILCTYIKARPLSHLTIHRTPQEPRLRARSPCPERVGHPGQPPL